MSGGGIGDVRGKLEQMYAGSAAHLSALESSKKPVTVTDRSTLTPADERSVVKVAEATSSTAFGSLGPKAATPQELEEQRRRAAVHYSLFIFPLFKALSLVSLKKRKQPCQSPFLTLFFAVAGPEDAGRTRPAGPGAESDGVGQRRVEAL